MNDLKSGNKQLSVNEDWYKELVEECKAIITEAVFTSRWALVEGNWELGRRIREDMNWQKWGNNDLQGLANAIGQSERTIYYALAIFDKFPDLNKIPEGKNISMNKLITKYLPNASGVHVGFNSGENEWYTPSYIIELARETMGTINCDPASSNIANEIVKATKYFTIKDNGLLQKWSGNVWMNPPYSQPLIQEFTSLLVKKYKEKEISQALVLVNNATETVFYQEMLKVCTGVCFIKGRIKFIDQNGQSTGMPLQGQTILYFGNNRDKFKQNFSNIGIILWTEEK
jgi:ParB family chromosome partitioning protein